jgi:L-asparaginase
MAIHRLTVLGVGGTISMTGTADGLYPTRSASQVLGDAAGDHNETIIEARDFRRKPSASLSYEDVTELARMIDQCAAEGATGIIVTQGTDTMEETSFAIELLSQAALPIVFTGAMRGASMPGHDGPRNLADAIHVARYLAGQDTVLVVMNGQAHAARRVMKMHTTALEAFASPGTGPVMTILEDLVCQHAEIPGPRIRIPVENLADPLPRVAIVTIGLGDDGQLLGLLPSSLHKGCILAALGAGHVPETMMPDIESLAGAMPVILASRINAGPVLERTYGYRGSETDLMKRGVLTSGWLGAPKARILLTLTLAAYGPEAGAHFSRIADALTPQLHKTPP